jgi:hypothetical protein
LDSEPSIGLELLMSRKSTGRRYSKARSSEVTISSTVPETEMEVPVSAAIGQSAGPDYAGSGLPGASSRGHVPDFPLNQYNASPYPQPSTLEQPPPRHPLDHLVEALSYWTISSGELSTLRTRYLSRLSHLLNSRGPTRQLALPRRSPDCPNTSTAATPSTRDCRFRG